MTQAELAPILFSDPFTRYYTAGYTELLKINDEILQGYINNTIGQPINDMAEYLQISTFFQNALEPVFGVNNDIQVPMTRSIYLYKFVASTLPRLDKTTRERVHSKVQIYSEKG